MRLLFICTANISRSFLAEMLFRHEMEQRQLTDIFVSSAGTNAVPGHAPDSKMVEYLVGRKIPFVDHVSRLVQQADVESADFIFVMEKKQAADINRRWPRSGGKVKLLGRYVSAGGSSDEIIDPYGGSAVHYRLAQAQISLAIENIVRDLGPFLAGGAEPA